MSYKRISFDLLRVNNTHHGIIFNLNFISFVCVCNAKIKLTRVLLYIQVMCTKNKCISTKCTVLKYQLLKFISLLCNESISYFGLYFSLSLLSTFEIFNSEMSMQTSQTPWYKCCVAYETLTDEDCNV